MAFGISPLSESFLRDAGSFLASLHQDGFDHRRSALAPNSTASLDALIDQPLNPGDASPLLLLESVALDLDISRREGVAMSLPAA
jgi:hypothetical protein